MIGTLLWRLQQVGLLQQDSVGRTALFSFLLPIPVQGINIGILLMLLKVDRESLYGHFFRVPLMVATQFLFVAATLSVSTVWVEMANKARAVRFTVEPQSENFQRSSSRVDGAKDQVFVSTSKFSHLHRCFTACVQAGLKCADTNGSRGNYQGGHDTYRAKVYGTALGSSLATLYFLLVLADPLLGSFVVVVVMALVGASFLMAGNHIYRTLLRRSVITPDRTVPPKPTSPISQAVEPPVLAIALLADISPASRFPAFSKSLAPLRQVSSGCTRAISGTSIENDGSVEAASTPSHAAHGLSVYAMALHIHV